jgi:hypothetical protein
MTTSATASSASIPADLKGAAESGLTVPHSEHFPVSLSCGLKAEIQNIIGKYAADRTSLTSAEFLTFLKEEQQVSLKKKSS